MIQTMFKERALPPLLSRIEMLEILQREVYGYLPAKPDDIDWETQKNIVPAFCAGKAVLHRVTARISWKDGRTFSFPFNVSIPTTNGKHPFFIHINFRNSIPDLYMPTEELIDNGFAVLSFCYSDITTDDEDFSNGLAGVLFQNKEREGTTPGKLILWAWAAQRVMDYAQTREDVLDLRYSIVCGHSRLGKTALLAGALDSRFAFCYSNDSGCSGAAVHRGKKGERIRDICTMFPYWFCKNYHKYMDPNEELPFDQHYLLACIAPRKVLIGSAELDAWADPISEMIACVGASPAFLKGFQYENCLPQAGDFWGSGDIGYHIRAGLHYFSRTDWHCLIRFVRRYITP